MDQTEKNTQRLTDLESSLMHHQNDLDSINEVVLDLSRQINVLTAMMERLKERVEAASTGDAPGKLEDEKPPHY